VEDSLNELAAAVQINQEDESSFVGNCLPEVIFGNFRR